MSMTFGGALVRMLTTALMGPYFGTVHPKLGLGCKRGEEVYREKDAKVSFR